MEFTAIDLSRMTTAELVRRPKPISSWPTVAIDLDRVRSKVCIASWRRDVTSINEFSARLSECAWDALHLGFTYMLCDIVSVPQYDLNLGELIVEYSKLYAELPVVISYQVDPYLKRAWLKHEAYQLLSSRTPLDYLLHKWTLPVPLIGSLIINQVCVRRLGISNITKDYLYLCDTDQVSRLTIRDLHLLDNKSSSLLNASIVLDRRRQTFASDVLLVHELRILPGRPELIVKLRSLQSNGVVVPSLCIIWAAIDGLALSIRGCDWDVRHAIQICTELMEAACTELNGRVNFSRDSNGFEFNLTGAINSSIRLEIPTVPSLNSKFEDLLVRNFENPATFQDADICELFLSECLNIALKGIEAGHFPEPAPLPENHPDYELLFDDYAGPCSERVWDYGATNGEIEGQ